MIIGREKTNLRTCNDPRMSLFDYDTTMQIGRLVEETYISKDKLFALCDPRFRLPKEGTHFETANYSTLVFDKRRVASLHYCRLQLETDELNPERMFVKYVPYLVTSTINLIDLEQSKLGNDLDLDDEQASFT